MSLLVMTSTHKTIAIFTALLHLFLLEFLDGTLADGPNEKAPQTYVTTASQILANVFQICLQASLSTSSVQCLWYTLRHSTLRISTIDSLFLLRFAPLSFKWSALRAAPQLILLVVLIWAIYVATIFPPGTLTVKQTTGLTNYPLIVPNFNASFVSWF